MSLTAEMASAADAWLRSLSADQRKQAQFPGPGRDDAERTRWFYTPVDHGGLTLNDQRPLQQQLAMRLLAAGLSMEGYAVAATVIGLENVLDRIESWREDWGRERGRDPGLYYFRVFGSPADPEWGWRCGGHHLSVNYTITGGRVASCTPCFIGSNPAEVALLAGGTLRPLGDIERIARELARDLDRRGQAAASLHTSAVSDIVSGNRARVLDGEDHRTLAITERPQGVAAGALTQDEQARLLLLVEGYVRRFPEEIAGPWLARYRDGGGLAGLHFGYAGAPADRGPVYYRLQDQRLLVEYDNTQNGANHAHTVIRDLESDFGFDALAEHQQAFHPGE